MNADMRSGKKHLLFGSEGLKPMFMFIIDFFSLLCEIVDRILLSNSIVVDNFTSCQLPLVVLFMRKMEQTRKMG